MWTENPIFREDLDRLTSYDYIPWDDLRDSTVFITGATGLIGYTAVCALLRYDQLHDAGIKVVALVRDVGRAEAKFSRQIADGCDITFIRGSVEYLPEIVGKIDYIIHGACPTSSQYFVDHAENGEVLMLAYMNEESLQKTLETGYTWFWSRSRQELWNKGATSGHFQKVVEMYSDCDDDTLLIKVIQTGAACHTGHRSCFFTRIK